MKLKKILLILAIIFTLSTGIIASAENEPEDPLWNVDDTGIENVVQP